MKRALYSLILLLPVACGGTPEAPDPPAERAPAAASPAAPAAPAAPGTPEKVLGGAQIGVLEVDDWVRVNSFTRMLYAGDLERLYESFSIDAKRELSFAALSAMRQNLIDEFGEEVDVVAAKKEEKQGYRAYKRAARFSASERLVEVAWVIGPDEAIAGLFITPQRSETP